jgi:hypothetical protein
MKRLNKTLRRRRQRRQRSRRVGRRHTRRQRHRGGALPVPSGSLVGVSFKGEYGAPVLMTTERYEEEKEGLED